jgi:hypothetical protein
MGEGMHADLKQFCDMHLAALTAANVTYDDVVHALGLVSEAAWLQYLVSQHQIYIFNARFSKMMVIREHCQCWQ